MTSPNAFIWPDSTKKRRRTFTRDFKRELVEQTLAPGASISGIALANGLNTNQLFAWRRKLMGAALAAPPAVLLPVQLDVTNDVPYQLTTASATTAAALTGIGHIEIVMKQATVHLRGQVDQAALRMILQCLAP